MTDREKHIKNLSYIMDSMPDDACGEWRDSLAYAISSLKTDLKYDLMYEGEEIYTKADMIAMLEELKTEIEEVEIFKNVIGRELTHKTPTNIKQDCIDIIQQKIDKLKE